MVAQHLETYLYLAQQGGLGFNAVSGYVEREFRGHLACGILVISMFLSTNVIPVRLVVARALMAIAQKVIVFDFASITPPFLYGTATVVMTWGITCWLITKRS